jgi:hypothetical protein
MLIVGIGIDSPSNIRQFIETTIISYPIVLGGLGGNDINKMLGESIRCPTIYCGY